MSYRQILLTENEDFKRGFLAAVDFFDGSDSFQIIHQDEESVTVQIEDFCDNDTYIIKDGKVVFDSTGVEL